MVIEDQCEETEIMSKFSDNQRPECELQKKTGFMFMLSLEYFHTDMLLVWSAMQLKHFGVFIHDIIKKEWRHNKKEWKERNIFKYSV